MIIYLWTLISVVILWIFLPDEFGYGFGTIFSQHDCFIRYGCGNKTSFTSKIISSIYQKEGRLDMNPIKVLEWKGMYPIKKILLVMIWLFGCFLCVAGIIIFISDNDVKNLLVGILFGIGGVVFFSPIKNMCLQHITVFLV